MSGVLAKLFGKAGGSVVDKLAGVTLMANASKYKAGLEGSINV